MMETISRFKFSNYSIKKSVIEFKDIEDVSPKLTIGIEVEGEDDRKNNRFILAMEVKVWDEKKNMDIQVIISGVFEFETDCIEKELDAYFNTNAPALLFPYVRAYVTSLTALSGVTPVILPTLNISHLGKELKENTKKI